MTDKPETIASSDMPDPAAFLRFEERYTSKLSSGDAPKTIPHRRARVTIPLGLFLPETFDEDMVVVIRSLTPKEELIVHRRAAGADEKALSMEMAKQGLDTVNGLHLKDYQTEMFWDALTLAGRMALGACWMENCAGSVDDVGNALKSASVV